MKIENPPGAQFEILVDGKPRSYRDIKAVAVASAEAKAQFQKSWEAWKAWAKMEEAP
jgi:hypothetical protein